MRYRCERCGRTWDDRDAADNAYLCTRKCGGPLTPAEQAGGADLVQKLPHPLAVVLHEYLAEPNDYIKLHRLCDAAEMLTRFLATVVLAELAAAGESSAWPQRLRAAVLRGIE